MHLVTPRRLILASKQHYSRLFIQIKILGYTFGSILLFWKVPIWTCKCLKQKKNCYYKLATWKLRKICFIERVGNIGHCFPPMSTKMCSMTWVHRDFLSNQKSSLTQQIELKSNGEWRRYNSSRTMRFFHFSI